MPRISVVVPAYNAENFIEEAISSILSQTFQDLEVIVIDDGSVDSTSTIVNSISDSRLQYHRLAKNAGTVVAVNLGYSIATGEFIANMDADDVAIPSRFQFQYEFLKQFPHITVLGGSMELFGEHTGLATVPLVDAQIKAQFLPGFANIYNPTAMIRKAFLDDRAFACEPGLKGAFDWGFWVEIMLRGGNFANLEQPLVRYRVHPAQQSRDFKVMRSELALVRCRVLELFYPNFSAAERSLLEPLLQWVDPPPISANELKLGLELLDQAVLFTKPSIAREDRAVLDGYLRTCRNQWRDALNRLNLTKGGANNSTRST